MSKIDELIAELCPDGVGYKTLGEVCKIYDGTHQTPKYTKEGVKFVSVENIKALYQTEKYISWEDFDKNYKVKPQINDVFMTRIGSIGVCTVIDRNEDLAYYVTLTLIRPDQNLINSKYVKYIIESAEGQKELRKRTLIHATPIKINLGEIGNIRIPLPPLPIQKEIVRILDKFTTLEAELEAELEARKEQYEYYRNTLLTFDDDVPMVALGDVFDLKNGYTPSKANADYWKNGTIPWFRMEDIRENGRILSDSIQHVTPQAVKGNLFPAYSVILATSATIGEHALLTVDALANQRFTFLSIKQIFTRKLNMKFFYHYCFVLDEWCKNNTTLGNFLSVDMTKFRAYKIPIPPFEEQERVVAILDRFDALVNDITQGLPAEIEARKKQYEYYRDKLLTFKENVS